MGVKALGKKMPERQGLMLTPMLSRALHPRLSVTRRPYVPAVPTFTELPVPPVLQLYDRKGFRGTSSSESTSQTAVSGGSNGSAIAAASLTVTVSLYVQPALSSSSTQYVPGAVTGLFCPVKPSSHR